MRVYVARGHDERVVLHVDTEDAEGNIVPYDFTGKTAQARVVTKSVRTNDDDAEPLFPHYTVANGRLEIPAPASGDVVLNYQATEIDTAGRFASHLELKDVDEPDVLLSWTLVVQDT